MEDEWETVVKPKKSRSVQYNLSNAKEWESLFSKWNAMQGSYNELQAMLNSLTKNTNLITSDSHCYDIVLSSLRSDDELKPHHDRLIKSMIQSYENANDHRFNLTEIDKGIKLTSLFIIYKKHLNKSEIGLFNIDKEQNIFNSLLKKTDNKQFLTSGGAIMQAAKLLKLNMDQIYSIVHPKQWIIATVAESEQTVLVIEIGKVEELDLTIFNYSLPYFVKILKHKTEGFVHSNKDNVGNYKGPKTVVWKLMPSTNSREYIKELLTTQGKGLCFSPKVDGQGNFNSTNQWDDNTKRFVFGFR